MGLSVVDDIKSITDLKRNTNQIIRQVHETGRPVVLTVNGKAEAVLLGAVEYDKIANALAMFKILRAGENEIKENKVRDAEKYFKEFRVAKKIQS
jgi:prevent-host-death family protein